MISTGMCTSFLGELLEGIHDFTADTFMLALYTSSAGLDYATTAYSTSGEASGAGYSAGGVALTVSDLATSGKKAFIDFDDVSIESSTITARGALIYNASKSNRAVAVFDFGTDRASSDSSFTIQFPAADANDAILRITGP